MIEAATTTICAGRLFVVVDPSRRHGSRGAIAYSATIAALVPFGDRESAIAGLIRAGADPATVRVHP